MAVKFLRFFTPSVLRLPDEARRELGEAADLVERAAFRRIWEAEGASYQVVAVRVPTRVAPPEYADMLVRRRYTLEPGSVIVRGSVFDALRRALSCLDGLREADICTALLQEYNQRGVNAGLAQASTLLQCFVLAPASVYTAAENEAEQIRTVRAELKPGGLGFQFFTTQGDGDDFQVVSAPSPFDALALRRPVETIHR